MQLPGDLLDHIMALWKIRNAYLFHNSSVSTGAWDSIKNDDEKKAIFTEFWDHEKAVSQAITTAGIDYP